MNNQRHLSTPDERDAARLRFHHFSSSSSPAAVDVRGRAPLLIPNSTFSRAVVMGNEASKAPLGYGAERPHNGSSVQRASNLTVMMEQHERQQQRQQLAEASSLQVVEVGTNDGKSNAIGPSEADSACGLPPPPLPHPAARVSSSSLFLDQQHHRHTATGAVDRVRRCISSKELGTIAPPSGSPYAAMLVRKGQLEESTRKRLQQIRSAPRDLHSAEHSDESTSNSSRQQETGTKESRRRRRRAAQNKEIVEDLCDLVADLFISESNLLKPMQHYGVSEEIDASVHSQRDHVIKTIRAFVAALPVRYALGTETPSEVLLHMRLMTAARAERTKAVVHIDNLENHGDEWSKTVAANSVKGNKELRLVTIVCRDTQGLLEHITKALASGGSRVLDADVMLSTDGVVLDRFVVEMSGRLQLNKLSQHIEDFLKQHVEKATEQVENNTKATKQTSPPSGPIYYSETDSTKQRTTQDLVREIETAVPLTQVLETSATELSGLELPRLRKLHSMPPIMFQDTRVPSFRLPMRPDQEPGVVFVQTPRSQSVDDSLLQHPAPENIPKVVSSTRQRRPLVNRRATPDLAFFESPSMLELKPLDYVTVPSAADMHLDNRVVPLIPFDELMLIETIGTGRVSTIYRAAWQRASQAEALSSVHMVALKVAMVNAETGDTGHVDELRREADIAARLQHPNICDLVGLAADNECFCLAYDYCEGGSLLSLLSDSRRYYEYLPIALDIANGMAYLHSRDVIHRDLKPSNILLTKDHRAKIADFGISVANKGQELTAETGTYRYMAPEVIRHESYSSNADVYSFGICLWQLITREIPFATMTPIQAAYAVAEGQRPPIPTSTPRRLQEIIEACWDQDNYRRPSFTYIAMALADYAKMAFSPANVGAQTLQIANEMLAHVDGNSTVNVDITAPVVSSPTPPQQSYVDTNYGRSDSMNSDVGLEI